MVLKYWQVLVCMVMQTFKAALLQVLCGCQSIGMFHFWSGKLLIHVCVCVDMLIHTRAWASVCMRVNEQELRHQVLFEKSEGRCRSIGWLCMTLMNTLIGPHEDGSDCDRLIGVYCAVWLDERGHDDGCLPLWQGRRGFRGNVPFNDVQAAA